MCSSHPEPGAGYPDFHSSHLYGSAPEPERCEECKATSINLDMYVVVLYEPALPGERLTLEQQTNEVFGPFSYEAQADAWIARFQEAGSDHRFRYLITRLSPPPEAKGDA